MGQPIVVDSRPGAGGNIGVEAVIRASADGYTLTSAGANDSINATRYKHLPFDFIRERLRRGRYGEMGRGGQILRGEGGLMRKFG